MQIWTEKTNLFLVLFSYLKKKKIENFYCTPMVCNGDHYPIKIALNNVHKYSTFNFQKLILLLHKGKIIHL